jgi:hypothetical protein
MTYSTKVALLNVICAILLGFILLALLFFVFKFFPACSRAPSQKALITQPSTNNPRPSEVEWYWPASMYFNPYHDASVDGG